MSSLLSRLLSLLIALLPMSLSAAWTVHASVPPIAALAAEVGGAHVQTFSLLRPGDNPVTFAPTPRQLLALADSDLYLRAGLPFERTWMTRLRQVNSRMRVVDVREGVAATPLHHAHGAHVQRPDPHLWSDPLAAIHIADNIRRVLSELDPAHADDYRRGFEATQRRLQRLDRWIRARLRQRHADSFLVYHPAWGYFARRYGLNQLAIEHEGKQGGARWLTGLIERARRKGIRVVLIQPQFDHRQAEQIARAIGARLVTIDPLAADQQSELRRLVEALTETAS